MYARHIQDLKNAVGVLQEVLNDWIQTGKIPEAEWGKTRKLEFQDELRHRNERIAQLNRFTCTACPDFEEHVSPHF